MVRVLVVEDNPDNLELIRCILVRGGYEVIAATSGEAGVERAMSERFDFVLMDIGLPGIDGLEATRRIRQSPSGGSIPIIAITSYAMRGDMEKVLAAGCDGYFEKPIDPLRIMNDIHAILRRAQ